MAKDLRHFAEALFKVRSSYECMVPLVTAANQFLDRTMSLLFPHLSESRFTSADALHRELENLGSFLEQAIQPACPEMAVNARQIRESFMDRLPEVYERLSNDSLAMFQGDPAAKSVAEVIVSYPGFLAICGHRIAHQLHLLKVPIFPRIIAEQVHQRTGIDINPGAQIGHDFCIDHGTGIVIGETTVIGNRVKLYQGVTLGALSVDKKLADSKRHPTIEDDVVIYANATILGGQTVIGKGSTIGGNVWITSSVPPGSKIYYREQTT